MNEDWKAYKLTVKDEKSGKAEGSRWINGKLIAKERLSEKIGSNKKEES